MEDHFCCFAWYFQLLGICVKSHLSVLTLFFFTFKMEFLSWLSLFTLHKLGNGGSQILSNLPNVMLLISGKIGLSSRLSGLSPGTCFSWEAALPPPVTTLSNNHFIYDKHRASHEVHS